MTQKRLIYKLNVYTFTMKNVSVCEFEFRAFHLFMLLVHISLPGILSLLAQLLNPTHFSRLSKSGTFSVMPFLLTPSSGGMNILH